MTFVTSTGSLGDGEPLSVYQYWYFWPGCALAPTSPLCLAGHSANDWEPVYIYWKTTNPAAPILLAVYTRFHFFFWRQTAGSQVTLNGTQPIITFSTTYHAPTVDTFKLTQFIKPANESLSIPYNPSQAPPFIGGAWIYSVSNGGPHTLTVFLDPGSPPASGPTAYENDAAGNAGPIDPFTLYGTGRNFQVGFIAGGVTTLAIFGLLTAVRIDIAGFRKVLGRK